MMTKTIKVKKGVNMELFRHIASDQGIRLLTLPRDVPDSENDRLLRARGAGRCPTEWFPAFVEFGEVGGKRGTVWLPHSDHEGWTYDGGWDLRAIILHEMAHAVVGKREDLTIPLERSWVARWWGVESTLWKECLRYGDGAADEDELRAAVRVLQAAGHSIHPSVPASLRLC